MAAADDAGLQAGFLEKARKTFRKINMNGK
ncbi:hypothetical protein C7434_1370 [Pantoea sp. PNA 14-12]|nr:hypothetical protein C7434_1370 [Pantoea sp. PNA 14-12]